jgi:hypothetical protein
MPVHDGQSDMLRQRCSSGLFAAVMLTSRKPRPRNWAHVQFKNARHDDHGLSLVALLRSREFQGVSAIAKKAAAYT